MSSRSRSSSQDKESEVNSKKRKKHKKDKVSSDDSSCDEQKSNKKKKRKAKHKKAKLAVDSSSSSSSDSEEEQRKRKSKEHKKSKQKKKKHKNHKSHKKKEHKKVDKKHKMPATTDASNNHALANGVPLFAFQERKLKEASLAAKLAHAEAHLPVSQFESKEEPKPKAPGPMSKQEYEKLNSQIREVRDPKTGRVRLVRGEGEILEQIVSKEEQQKIRRLATAWDGVMTYGAPT